MKIKFSIILFILLITNCLFVQCKNTQKGISDAAQSIKNNEAYLGAIYDGNSAYIKKDYNSALSFFQKAEELKKNAALPKFLIAKCFFQLNNFENALLFAENAAKLELDNYDIAQFASILYEKFEQRDKITEILYPFTKTKYQTFAFEEIIKNETTRNNYDVVVSYSKSYIKTGFNKDFVFSILNVLIEKKLFKQSETILAQIKKYSEGIAETALYDLKIAANLHNTQRLQKLTDSLNKKNAMTDEMLAILMQTKNLEIEHSQNQQFIDKILFSTQNDFSQKIEIILQIVQSRMNFEEKVTYIEKIKLYYPEQKSFFIISADFYALNGIYEQEREDLQKALEIDNYDFTTQLKLIEILYKNKDITQLAQETEKAKEYFPNQPEIYFYSGIAAQILGYFDKSIQDFQSAYDLSFDNDNLKKKILYNQALTHFYNSNNTKSLEILRKLISEDANDIISNETLCLILAENTENFAECNALCEKISQIQPESEFVFTAQALMSLNNNQNEKAISLLKNIETNFPIIDIFSAYVYKSLKMKNEYEKIKLRQVNQKFLKNQIKGTSIQSYE